MSGFHAWLLQRITAVYLAIFIVVAVFVLTTTDINYVVWKEWFSTTWIQISLLLFAFSLLLHAWIGVRDVLVDYIHSLGLRLFLLSVSALFLVANGFWLLLILWGKP